MSDSPMRFQTMADLGEKEFIAALLPRLSPHPSFLNGFGDDASAIAVSHDQVIIFKIDRAATPLAARRGWVDHRMWGRLAVTSNCSDILAGGGSPAAVMIALIVPRDWPADAAIETIEGCAEECAAHDIAFAGGDTKEGTSAELVGSAIGVSTPSKVLTRRRAKRGDLIVLAGELGGFLGSYLQILELGDPHGSSWAAAWLDYVSHPRARWAEGAFMRDSFAATGAMDTSDGLYDAIATLTTHHGAEILLDSLPYHEIAHECSARLDIPLLNLGLGVGDWNIVYTVDESRWHTLADQIPSTVQLTVIGRVTERRGIRWHEASGSAFYCQPIVNQHFKARLEDESTLVVRLRTERMLEPAAD
jgi:thiamine-monophosphate kinase